MKTSALDDRRVLIGGGALLAVLIVLATWFLLVSPQLSAADESATQQADAELQNVTLQRKNSQLAEQDKQISSLQAGLADAKAGLPVTTALPEFTNQVTAAASVAGVSLTTVSVSPPAPVGVAAAAADGTAAAAPAQQAIAVSVTSTGRLAQQTAFLRALQDGERRVLVTSSQVTTSSESEVASVDAASSMTAQVTIFTGS